MFAASARSRGLEVTVVDPQAVPLERVLGREVGAVYRDVHLVEVSVVRVVVDVVA